MVVHKKSWDWLKDQYTEISDDPFKIIHHAYKVTKTNAIWMMGAGVFAGGEGGRELFIEGAQTLFTLGTDDLLEIILPDFVERWIFNQGIDALAGGTYDILVDAPWKLWKGSNIESALSGGAELGPSGRFTDERLATTQGRDYVARHETEAIMNDAQGKFIAELREAKDQNRCYRCTRSGHQVINCYAVRYPNGGIIDD